MYTGVDETVYCISLIIINYLFEIHILLERSKTPLKTCRNYHCIHSLSVFDMRIINRNNVYNIRTENSDFQLKKKSIAYSQKSMK